MYGIHWQYLEDADRLNDESAWFSVEQVNSIIIESAYEAHFTGVSGDPYVDFDHKGIPMRLHWPEGVAIGCRGPRPEDVFVIALRRVTPEDQNLNGAGSGGLQPQQVDGVSQDAFAATGSGGGPAAAGGMSTAGLLNGTSSSHSGGTAVTSRPAVVHQGPSTHHRTSDGTPTTPPTPSPAPRRELEPREIREAPWRALTIPKLMELGRPGVVPVFIDLEDVSRRYANMRCDGSRDQYCHYGVAKAVETIVREIGSQNPVAVWCPHWLFYQPPDEWVQTKKIVQENRSILNNLRDDHLLFVGEMEGDRLWHKKDLGDRGQYNPNLRKNKQIVKLMVDKVLQKRGILVTNNSDQFKFYAPAHVLDYRRLFQRHVTYVWCALDDDPTNDIFSLNIDPNGGNERLEHLLGQ
ncbi:unnamed protein product [Vitrella brassicaformis CCMP3155]|uniref:Uncharacterized protein n=1 Tax=Vitrella brassicaformis (strain CCMP3155) TaxID=1169540 RepID=A0A0G4FVF3_VITBC|nr:unnamed protein product [Vitrella brassicaformis CCMP3155]|mmetsp:Transcript_15621/g.44665  ORF Transcript_15621/g.44665 Transcript_15621/m.44665 type:complete len:407 (+) Transcript_15621:45-1265(+)|eukprot:CEM18682.1 unnamed protein product [Vitrella brassicaformis CCMP3155]